MRICFIEDTLLHGGTQIWVTEAIRYLLSEGIEITLLAPEDSWVMKQCEELGITTAGYEWELMSEFPERFSAVWTEALAESDAAVCTVHPSRQGFHCAEFAGKCIQIGGLKTHLITKTGTVVPAYPRTFYLPSDEISCSVITIAEFTHNYLKEKFQIPAERIQLIYQGTDINRFSQESHTNGAEDVSDLISSDAAPILGCLGSFEERKGQKILLQAAAALVRDGLSNLTLLLVGDGPDEALLRQLAEDLEISSRIIFVPFTSQPETIYPLLDITILPSLFREGLPNVLLESLSMGVPVVSTDIGGVKEVVIEGKTGKVVPVGEAEPLAAAIQSLWLEKEAYQKIKTYAPQFIRENFDKEKQFAQFLEHYKKVTDRL